MQNLTAAFLPSAESLDKTTRKQHLASWGAYAAAAGAALAMSTNASAEIMYSGLQDITVSIAANGSGTNVQKTFVVAGLNQVLALSHHKSVSGDAALSAVNLGTQPHVGFFDHNTIGGDFSIANHYSRGQMISGAGAGNLGAVLRLNNGSNHNVGSFGPGTATGFVGFKTPSGDLGWIQVEVSDKGSPGYPNEAEVIDWAYNDVAGTPIAAGDTGITATPEPGTAALSLLAFGALGILALRKRRNELAVK